MPSYKKIERCASSWHTVLMQTQWREDVPVSKSPARFFIFATKPYLLAAATATFFACTGNAFAASVSYVFKLIANAAAALTQGGAYEPFLAACMLYIGILAAAKICYRLGGLAAARWAIGAQSTARYALTSYVTLHSRSYFSDRFAGSIMNKIRHAASGMRDMVDVILWQFLELVINVVISFVIAYFVSPTIAGIFFVWVLVVIVLNAYLVGKRVPLAARAHDLETGLNGATVDLLTNVSAMQEYARREFEIERLKASIMERSVAALKSWNFGEYMRLANSVVLVIFGSAMVFFTAGLAQNGLITIGDIILVVAIIFRIEGQLQALGSHLNRFAETWGEIQESLEEIIEPHEIPDQPNATPLKVSSGAITLSDVTFRYAENSVFEKLSVDIAAGERIGLVGRSGAGKSTLFRLMLHHHDLHGGTILIDGNDITHVTQESLRAAIAVVPQEPLLFHRTVRENIAYGRPGASLEEVQEAARLAYAHDFISRLSEGYDSIVGERGIKLSGGERQRVAIARAILKDAPILLLDEATAALDSESEVAIQKALHELMVGKTVIAIAHRLSTLREMDRILVLDGGKIVQEGSHDQLLAQGGIYADLWRHQAGGFLQDDEVKK
jgi:ATP-binding cassette, subfamily B, bacterial